MDALTKARRLNDEREQRDEDRSVAGYYRQVGRARSEEDRAFSEGRAEGAKAAPSGAARYPAPRRGGARRPRRGVAHRLAKATVAPVASWGPSGIQIVGFMLGLVLLYLLLTYADLAAKVVNGIRAAVQWVIDPRPIPYAA